ncbi:HNH endonuclease [Streptomyces nojiriensis]|uniref:HNH endonuclease n=1 Tax=Streptomyces nojiriensis TaxID=66374 RepID=UPI002E18A5AB
MQERGTAWCDWCLETYGADEVDVDHVRPLSLGGEDADGNVQVLCHGCHRFKTATEFGAAAPVRAIRAPEADRCGGLNA